MIIVNEEIRIPDEEVELTAVRASGPGGQHVNKVSSAVHLRFDIHASSLPEVCKQRLLRLKDRRINKQGVVVIKAQRYRNQDRNQQDAIERLITLVRKSLERKPKRIPTRPGAGARKRRLDEKARRGRVKTLRGRVRNID